ncbi:M56 family metallopeptidase [Streptosporangium sp. NPDC002544]|uniref:M56 family metallopeptidase n=1 Tax=Streptosporangium sp. NPDC002544 TaxID=3154538 RepID=UPI0033200F44
MMTTTPISIGRMALRWLLDLRAARALGTGVVTDDRPFAMTVPGRDGGLVVSTALLRLLSRPELEVVFRHESAHLKHRHHIYLAISAIASKIFPPLAYPHRSLRFVLERWADEEAAAAVGDRILTARTIGRVALANPQSAAGPHPALADSHVVQRVEALLGKTPSHNRLTGPVLLSGTWMATGGAVSSALQLHHAGILLVLL